MNHTTPRLQMTYRNFFIIAIFILLTPTPTHPLFDLSPWIVVSNTTKFDLDCEIQALCYRSDYQDENLTIIANNNESIGIECNQDQDENGQDFMKFTITFACPANKTTAFNPIFCNNEDQMFNPEVTQVRIVQESLQLALNHKLKFQDQRSFTVQYNSESGITMTAQEIAMHIKCLNNFKQTIRNIIAAALSAANHLPY